MVNKSIISFHQGYELYGSDRSFVTSLKALKNRFKHYTFDAVLPKEGAIVPLLKKEVDHLSIEPFAVIRKRDLMHGDFSAIIALLGRGDKRRERIKAYDIVYINSIVIFDYLILKLSPNQKKVIHIREIPTGFPAKVFQFLLSRSNAYFIFNSYATQKAFANVKSKKSFVLHNGVKGFLNIPVCTPNFDKLRILVIGRMSSWKGQDFFIEAMAQLDKKYINKIEVRIVGDVFEDQVHYRDRLFDLIDKHQLKNCINIHPFSSDPSDHFEWSNTIVVPSIKPEPFGRVAIEGMSAARVVIAADHGGLSEIIEHRRTGLLFKPCNHQSLCHAIIDLIDNPIDLQVLGQQARESFQNKFTDQKYKEGLIQIFDTIINS